jgi:hypothetical protein
MQLLIARGIWRRGAEDLDSQREAAREWTRALAEEEGRCHIPHLHSSRSQQNVVLWI